ncbi:unnamed protein product [Amoebophrya sp. A25]|nr:unnamed protein product [Amoebophrya sp. A25]|eukprot:GSA25T00009497001.1
MTEYRVDRSKHPAPGYVAVGRETVEDLGLGSKTGKARAVAGAPHLPGSSFGRPRHDRTFGRHAVAGEQRSRHEAETHLSATTRRYHLAVANSNPSVNAAVGTLRQTKSEGNIEPYSNDGAYKFEAEHVASLRGRAAGDEV